MKSKSKANPHKSKSKANLHSEANEFCPVCVMRRLCLLHLFNLLQDEEIANRIMQSPDSTVTFEVAHNTLRDNPDYIGWGITYIGDDAVMRDTALDEIDETLVPRVVLDISFKEYQRTLGVQGGPSQTN